MATPTRAERIEGGLVGLLVGDALGVPYEFHPPGGLPTIDRIEFDPPRGFARAHQGTPPGTWSDDGALALALLDSLLTCGRLDPDDLGRRFVDWYRRGDYAVDGRVFDVGIQTSAALRALEAGAAALDAGPADTRANGNGSLMRVLPLALWHRGDDPDLVRDACLQSRVTHGHPRSQGCCALYCLWARRTLDRPGDDAWAVAVAAFRAAVPIGSPARDEVEAHVRPDDPPAGGGTGYVVDCLNSARLALSLADDYEGVAKAAVALGHDTDTTAAVAGGIAGLRHGLAGIPARWREGLRGREIVGPLLDRLAAR